MLWHLAALTLDLRTKKYPVPLARHISLQRSLGETPAYLGTHSTPSPEPSDTWADMSLWARHCSSRNDRPEKKRQRGQIYCEYAPSRVTTFTPGCKLHQNMTMICQLRDLLLCKQRRFSNYFHVVTKMPYHWCQGRLRCCRSGTGSSCPHSICLRSWAKGCYRSGRSTALLLRRSESSHPRDPTRPSHH